MKVEAQLDIVSDPLTHRVCHFDELVDSGRWFVCAPESWRTGFIGRVTHRTQHLQTIPSLRERLF